MKLADILLSYNQIEVPKRDVTPTALPKPYYEIPVEENTQEEPVETPTATKKPSVYDYWESLTTRAQNRTQQQPVANPSSAKWKSPYSDQKKWVSDMTAAYKRQGLNDNAIRNLIAKNALESGWGKSAQGDYNFGNITAGKYWKGRIVEGGDKNKKGEAITQKFRAYDTMDDYVKDEIQFLTNLYDFNQDDDLSTFLNKLQGGNSGKRHYAEDPSYKNKIKSIYLKV